MTKVDPEAIRRALINIRRGLDAPSNRAAMCLARNGVQIINDWIVCPECEGNGCPICGMTGLRHDGKEEKDVSSQPCLRNVV